MKKETLALLLAGFLLISGCQSSKRHQPSNSSSADTLSSQIVSKTSSTSELNTTSGQSVTSAQTSVTSNIQITSLSTEITSNSPTSLLTSSGGTTISTSNQTTSQVATSSITSQQVTSSPTSATTSVITSQTSHGITSSGTSAVSSTSGDPVIDTRLLGIRIRTSSYELKVSASKLQLTVDYDFNDGFNENNTDNSVNWESLNPTIGTVDQYGRVSGVRKGKCTIKCTTVVDHCEDTIDIFIYESENDIEKSWKKLGPSDTVNAKDIIILACPQKGKAATAVDTGHKLDSTSVTFNADKSVLTDPSDAAQFFVGLDDKGHDGFNLEIETEDKPKYLGATNKENVSFFDSPKSSQTLWKINYDYENSCWDMRPATNVDGWMMYNSDIDQFANYLSNETDFMFVVSLYRYTRTIKL